MTWPEVEEALARGAGVLLPVGSTEQHGYHLPLATHQGQRKAPHREHRVPAG
jgi:creatinine amidohydrolase/Fe(II)-dependent formamide hydrolase-like protein